MPKTPSQPRVPTFPPKDCAEPSELKETADEQDDQVPAIISKYIRTTDAGLSISSEMPFDDWLKGAPIYEALYRKSQWFWGDYLLQGEKLYGEAHAQAVGDFKEGHIDNVVSVCARFPHARRRPLLSFSHHKAAASLHASDSDRLLLEAERKRWNVSDLSKAVANIHEANGTKPKRGKRKKGSNVHFKVNANADSQPLTLDGHIEMVKPQLWNARPLTTLNREVYAGTEKLTTEEADQAAHENGHAHSAALMNWLEEHGFTRKEGDEQCMIPKQPATESEKSTPTLTTSHGQPVSTLTSNGASVVQPDAAPQIDQPAAPAAQPEPEKDLTPSTIPAEDIAAYIADLKAQRDTANELRERFATELIDVREQHKNAYWANEEKDKIIASLSAERDDAREQLKRYDFHTEAQTPLERAEAAILAFNEASQSVDWKSIGEISVFKTKWLGNKEKTGILNRADEVIDLLSGNPPAPRK